MSVAVLFLFTNLEFRILSRLNSAIKNYNYWILYHCTPLL